jgi:hypothetical protein
MEYWKQSAVILADMSITAMTLAAPERPSMVRCLEQGGHMLAYGEAYRRRLAAQRCRSGYEEFCDPDQLHKAEKAGTAKRCSITGVGSGRLRKYILPRSACFPAMRSAVPAHAPTRNVWSD